MHRRLPPAEADGAERVAQVMGAKSSAGDAGGGEAAPNQQDPAVSHQIEKVPSMTVTQRPPRIARSLASLQSIRPPRLLA